MLKKMIWSMTTQSSTAGAYISILMSIDWTEIYLPTAFLCIVLNNSCLHFRSPLKCIPNRFRTTFNCQGERKSVWCRRERSERKKTNDGEDETEWNKQERVLAAPQEKHRALSTQSTSGRVGGDEKKYSALMHRNTLSTCPSGVNKRPISVTCHYKALFSSANHYIMHSLLNVKPFIKNLITLI